MGERELRIWASESESGKPECYCNLEDYFKIKKPPCLPVSVVNGFNQKGEKSKKVPWVEIFHAMARRREAFHEV